MAMMLVLILALSQAPIVVLYSYIYFRDIKGREPLWLLVKTFAAGALICFPAGFLEAWAGVQTEPSVSVGTGILFASAFLVGLIEEGLKYLVLRWYPYRKPEFDEPYDGIMYSVSISLGFAALENLIYVSAYGFSTAVVRMFTAVPMHAMAAVVMGYEVGQAKFASSPTERARYLRKALWFPILLHGLYDFFLFLRLPQASLLAIAVLYWQVRITKSALTEFAQHVPGRKEGIVVPPAPPSPQLELPPKLGLATYSLGLILILQVLGIIAAILALSSPGNLTRDEQAVGLALVCGAVVALPFMIAARWKLKKGSRFAWFTALGAFVLVLPTPLFAVGLIGMTGLLTEKSREYFWTRRAPELPQ